MRWNFRAKSAETDRTMTSQWPRTGRNSSLLLSLVLWICSSTGCSANEGRVRDAGIKSGKKATVALIQSPRSNAGEITDQEVDKLVEEAIAAAGGVAFIRDGQTVVLKPNLVNTITTGNKPLEPTVNGITTDWRVTRAVARLVRSRNPAGKILVMEGSTESTAEAFTKLGYTPENFGTTVDEFIALEGSSCTNRSTDGLVQRQSSSGRVFWFNERFLKADAVISIAVLKTHSHAGVTGAVKNLAIGMTPAPVYGQSTCRRSQSPEHVDHSRAGLAQFIADYYGIRKADLAIIDGLQGIQNGPNPRWIAGGNYESDKMNMRLIIAGQDAVAVDAVEALVMGCNPMKVEHLTKLEASRVGVADPREIVIQGKPIDAVKKEFKGPDWACGAS